MVIKPLRVQPFHRLSPDVTSGLSERAGLVTRFSLLVIFISTIALAQDVTFRAVVDRDKVTLNDQIELTLTVTGSQDAGEPELPELDGFEIISSGSSSQFSFINGKMSASKSFTYILMPTKEGRLTIPPATVESGGKTLKTDPIEIEVIKGGQAPPVKKPASSQIAPQAPSTSPSGLTQPLRTEAGLKERIFIEVTTDKNTAYIGEQITMTFKLYIRDVRIDSLQYTPPVTKGFIAESMGDQKEYKDVINGIVYNVIELKTAIFPVTERELTIEPAKLRCDLLVREQRKRSGRGDIFDEFFEDPFFSSYQRYPFELESEPIKINIQQLPAENKPPSFKGAVGTYDLTAEATPQSLKAGEPINLVMKVSGAGNITQVPEPVIKDLTGFKSYDSEVKTDITGRDPQIAGQKAFQKVIIPQSENIKEIPAIELSYFDPVLNQYKTIKKGPIPITVAPAPKKEIEIVELIKEITPEDETKKQVQLLGKDIQFIETSPGRFTRIGEYWYKNILLWITVILIPLIFLGVLFAYKTHKTKLEEDIVYAKAKGAHKIAKRLLTEAIKYQKQDKPKEFYDAGAKAIQKFICDRLNVPPGSITTANLESLLLSKGIKAETINSIKNFLDTCDMVRFGAHTANQAEMKQVIKEVNSIIGILSKKL